MAPGGTAVKWAQAAVDGIEMARCSLGRRGFSGCLSRLLDLFYLGHLGQYPG